MSGITCACASEECAVLGCRRVRGIREAFRQKLSEPVAMINPCNCVGPQNGQPLCPCQMRGVVVKDGRYVRPEQDLGPAPGRSA